MSATLDRLREIGLEPPADVDDTFLTALLDHFTRCQDRLAKVALHAGRLKSIVDHSRDRCDLVTEIGPEVNDLLDALGAGA